MNDQMRAQIFGTKDDEELLREQDAIEQAKWKSVDARGARARADSDYLMAEIVRDYIPAEANREYKTILDVHLAMLKGQQCDVYFNGIERAYNVTLIDYDAEYLLVGRTILVDETYGHTTYREITVSRKEIRMIMRHAPKENDKILTLGTFAPGTEFPFLVFLNYNPKILIISIVFYKKYDIL